MDEEASQIERHIEQQRRELGYNVERLEERVRSLFHWRTQFQERPAAMLGAAFAGGVLLSALFGRRSRRRDSVWRKAA